MNIVTEFTEAHLAPQGPEDLGQSTVRVAWTPDEIELTHLARGGTIWLSTWGGLPVHSLQVQAP